MTTSTTADHAADDDAAPSGNGAAARAFVQVAVAILRRGDGVVLVQERRGDETFWSVPGGGVEAGELVHEAMAREVEEETGLRVHGSGELVYTVNTTTTGHPSCLALFFECRQWDGEVAVADPDGDVLQTVLLPVDDAVRQLEDSSASRPEMEPLIAHLRGEGRALWSYRDGYPA